MAHHHARDGYELTKVPEKFRPLLRRLQRGTWTPDELQWLLRTHPDLPPVVEGLIRGKLAALTGGENLSVRRGEPHGAPDVSDHDPRRSAGLESAHQ
jgi:hypothetical protein